MIDASTVAMTCTVKTVAKTKQVQEYFICADQMYSVTSLDGPDLTRFFCKKVNL